MFDHSAAGTFAVSKSDYATSGLSGAYFHVPSSSRCVYRIVNGAWYGMAWERGSDEWNVSAWWLGSRRDGVGRGWSITLRRLVWLDVRVAGMEICQDGKSASR
nr:hypothetical protein L203_01806 [Cryptococcus depauperatus CBS 7841]